MSTLREISVSIWTQRIKHFTLRGIPVRDDESGPSRTGITVSVKFFIRRDDESGPDSSSRTGISLSVKCFIRWVQIQLDISLSVHTRKTKPI